MEMPPSLSKISESERTPLVKWLLNLVGEQQQVIEQQQSSVEKLEAKVGQLEQQLEKLEAELKAGVADCPKSQKSRPAALTNRKNRKGREEKERVRPSGARRRAMMWMSNG